MTKPILSVDFDGVLNSYTSGWKGADRIPDRPVPGALEWLYEMTHHFRVAIFSSRSQQPGGILAMKNWLYDNHERMPAKPDVSWLLQLEFPLEKPPAMVGIDDRVLTFTGQFPSAKTLLEFKPWNKRS